MNLEKVAESINVLSKFCGVRDIAKLTKESLLEKYGINKADLLIFFGGSIPYGADIVADGMKNGISDKLMIVGGEGHTTQSLRDKIHKSCPNIDVEEKKECEIFSQYLEDKYKIKADFLEQYSTNCGNNVMYALDIIKSNNIKHDNIIIIQDSTMQKRMDSTFKKFVDSKVNIINFGAYEVNIVVDDNQLKYDKHIWGMWDIERYITLLMGEIPRLLDNEDGYGPNGKDFIAHTDVPKNVLEAFEYLKEDFSNLIRQANPLYATKQ